MTRTLALAAAAPGLALVLALAIAPRAAAQDATADDVARRLDELERGQQQIQRQLEEIKRLVQAQAQGPARPAAPAGPDVAGVELDLGDNPVKGQPGAGLVLVEFTDYQ